MKSFNEWLNENRARTIPYPGLHGYFLGRKIVCKNCGNKFVNKDPELGVVDHRGDYIYPADEGAISIESCSKCGKQALEWDPKDTWTEPENFDPYHRTKYNPALEPDYGPGGETLP